MVPVNDRPRAVPVPVNVIEVEPTSVKVAVVSAVGRTVDDQLPVVFQTDVPPTQVCALLEEGIPNIAPASAIAPSSRE